MPARTPRSQTALLALKLVALLIFIGGTNLGVVVRLRGIHSLGSFLGFGAVWLCSLVSLAYVAFCSDLVARALWTVVLVFSAAVGGAFWAINERSMTLLDGEHLLTLVAFVDSVIQFFGPVIWLPVACALIGILAVNLPPTERPAPGGPPARVLVPLLPVLAICAVLYKKGGEGTNGFPTHHLAPAYSVVLGFEQLTAGPRVVREPVRLAHTGKAVVRNLVVVMDESVRGDLLDLNDPGGAHTGLRDRPDLVNLGVVPSIANCSDTTNVAFRYGIGRSDYLKQLARNPSLWAYAKRAGYHTYYVESQRVDGALQNGMDEAELHEIDRHVQLPSALPTTERDIELARALRRILDDPTAQPAFIYVNKMGAHFPYEGKYPPTQAQFEPVMRRDYFGTEADPKGEWQKFTSAASDAEEQRLRFRNSYLNAVSWNARRFFAVLLDGLSLDETLILYTSDHGQDLHEDGRPAYSTHCTLGPAHANEALVPLAGITRNAAARATLDAAVANRGKLSQFNLIPSLLLWMGYAREELARNPSFEPPLDGTMPADNLRFLSTFFTRLAGKPVWNSSVVQPPLRATH